MSRESIDIEALLVRAYYEKAVHIFGTKNERQERILGKLIWGGMPGGVGGGFGGERVQTSCYASKMAAREGRLWEQLDLTGDSLGELHDAVLGLPTFYYEPTGGLDFLVWDAETALQLGHRITATKAGATIERVRRRGGSDPKRANELRPAGPARRVVAIEISTFLVCHGRSTDRPFVPDVVVTGRRPLYAGANKRAIGHEPVYETPLAEVLERRAIYATWHACLGILRDKCQAFGGLDVTGPVAPAAPWENPAPVNLGPVPRTRREGRKTREISHTVNGIAAEIRPV